MTSAVTEDLLFEPELWPTMPNMAFMFKPRATHTIAEKIQFWCYELEASPGFCNQHHINSTYFSEVHPKLCQLTRTSFNPSTVGLFIANFKCIVKTMERVTIPIAARDKYYIDKRYICALQAMCVVCAAQCDGGSRQEAAFQSLVNRVARLCVTLINPYTG